jgi:hypothetical protein
MNDLHLSPQMLQVIDALSSGANLTDAAAAAGVHCNTVAYWRRNVPPFQAALQQAESDRDLLFRERAVELADLAFASLREILTDPKSSPSVRLRAATFIIQTALGRTPAKAAKPPVLNNLSAAPPAPNPPVPPQPDQEAAPENLHKNAQQPYRRSAPKIGRNEPCPCGSGRKYKRCCLLKPQTAAA